MAMPTVDAAMKTLAAAGLEDIEDEFSITGYYRPYAGVTAAQSLRWVRYDTAVSAVRGLLGATYDDLKRRVEKLSRSFTGTFFAFDGNSGSRSSAPFALYGRFPDQDLYVCADRPPLPPALLAVKRAMNLVAASDASQDACDGYYRAVGELMRLLVGDAGPAPLPGSVLFDQAVFESTFSLEWVPY
uniref:Uncharacterized protein n=1 Tax=Avena sativa TaxID=4498 RepID=A0ACD5X9W8_AVESA